ncbi:hypothetical protein HY479_03885 [Candidatus Uhrbacteria bacterium]|nr:hypothetical protein [Candidatus Uhrbacteria bacterium]
MNEAIERFLQDLLTEGFRKRILDPEHFLSVITPQMIMRGFCEHPKLRSRIVTALTGMNEHIAFLLAPESCADILQIALDVGITTPDAVVQLIDPAQGAHLFEKRDVWSFITESGFWELKGDREYQQRVLDYMAVLLERAIFHDVVTAEEVLGHIGYDVIANHFRKKMAGVVRETVTRGRRGECYTALDFFNQVTFRAFIQIYPINALWRKVIAPRIAFAHGLITELPPQSLRPPPSLKGMR